VPQRPREDLPWNDVPADSDTLGADPEPDPAEVVGEEDDPAERDLAARRVPDPYEKYRQESLDRRLSEEEPDTALEGEDRAAGGLEVRDADDTEVDLAEVDELDPGEGGEDDEDAEDDAVLVRRRI